MEQLKEYIVTLNYHEDLEEFYKDMEMLRPTPYNCMPERTVSCSLRRPISRSTHYKMTEEEAVVLRKDPRVKSVSLRPEERGIEVTPNWIQTSNNWNKSIPVSVEHKNWGLLRCVEGIQRENWGTGDNGIEDQSATIRINEEGEDVDIIVVDGHIDPNHPEFAVNSDGTGGSRVIQFNWHSLTPYISEFDDDSGPLLQNDYVYTPYVDNVNLNRTNDNNHGIHVAGTIAGNTQGWARKANIYNINPYSTNPNNLDNIVLFDYIRAFHKYKPINPKTGRKNPTIVNNSWGYSYALQLSVTPITGVFYRGTTIFKTFTEQELRDYGIYVSGGFARPPASIDSINFDVEDAIADGIIIIGSAGNNYAKIDVEGGQDYNNYFVFRWFDGLNYFDYFNRGSSPTNPNGAICVGSIDILATEQKSTFSNCGPRVDIFAPGQRIISSTHTGTVEDPRGNGFLDKYSGTSMSGPQVCGVLACILETYPNMTPQEALDYITSYSKKNQLNDTGGGPSDYRSLQGSLNRYLAYYKERKDDLNVYPKLNYKTRPKVGVVYPRIRKR